MKAFFLVFGIGDMIWGAILMLLPNASNFIIWGEFAKWVGLYHNLAGIICLGFYSILRK